MRSVFGEQKRTEAGHRIDPVTHLLQVGVGDREICAVFAPLFSDALERLGLFEKAGDEK